MSKGGSQKRYKNRLLVPGFVYYIMGMIFLVWNVFKAVKPDACFRHETDILKIIDHLKTE